MESTAREHGLGVELGEEWAWFQLEVMVTRVGVGCDEGCCNLGQAGERGEVERDRPRTGAAWRRTMTKRMRRKLTFPWRRLKDGEVPVGAPRQLGHSR